MSRAAVRASTAAKPRAAAKPRVPANPRSGAKPRPDVQPRRRQQPTPKKPAAKKPAKGAARSQGLAHRSAPRRRPAAARGRRAAVRGHRSPFAIGAFLLVALLVLGVVTLQAVLSQGSFRMREISERNVELRGEYERLKLEVAELSSPARIAEAARQLGLRIPDPDDIRVLTVQAPAPTTPAPVEEAVTFAMKPVVRGRP